MKNSIQIHAIEGMIEWNSGKILFGMKIWGYVILMMNW